MLARFLDDKDTVALRAVRVSGTRAQHEGADRRRAASLTRLPAPAHAESKVKLSTSHAAGPGKAGREVYLVKKGRGVVPRQGFERLIQITSIPDSPLLSLLLGIRHVYLPRFKALQGAESVTPKIQKLMVDLFSNLLRQVRNSSHARRRAGRGESDVSGVASLQDELNYWTEAAENPNDRERAEAFARHLSPVAAKFSSAPLLGFADLNRLVRDVKDALDGLWNESGFDSGSAYSRARMSHLLDLVGQAIADNVRGKMGKLDLWGEPFHALQPTLREGIRLCKMWVVDSKDLTTIAWPRWNKDGKGPPHTDDGLTCLGRRLRSVLHLRSLQQELLRLIPLDKAERLAGAGLRAVVEPFTGMDVMDCGPLSFDGWNRATREFDRLLAPLEQEAAVGLKERISALASRPQLLLAEFRNFPKLMGRESMREILQSERETLLGQLLAHLQDLRQQFDDGVAAAEAKRKERGAAGGQVQLAGHNLSSTINSVIWADQLEHRCQQATTIVHKVLADVNGFAQFASESKGLEAEVAKFKQELFETWKADNIDSLEDADSPLRLETTGQLMELDVNDTGLLKVHFSERLVALLREVRQFSELGFQIPREIVSAVDKAQRFYRYGLKLKQVANFYNTIGEQIIPSQMGMLALEAQKFENIVSRTDVRWDNPDSCERYMKQLMGAAETLTSRNRRLRSKHQQLAGDVVKLMNTDLWTRKDQWTATVAEMRKVFAKEEKRNVESSMRAWRTHWDMQLYKALELQYRVCLQTLNEKVREMAVSVYFSGGTLRFKPPLEELRQRYFRNIKQLIDYPKNFKGFGAPDLYPRIPEQNADGLFMVYANAERLFIAMKKVKTGLLKWVALGSVNLDEFVSERLRSVEDWEFNFKSLIRKRREAEHLPEARKIGCFNVSFSALKLTIDDQMDRLNDSLLLSLKRAAAKEYKEVESFLDEALDTLTALPKADDVRVMLTAKQRWAEIDSSKGAVERVMLECERKNKLLRRMAAVPLDMAALRSKWNEQFLTALAQFDEDLVRRKDELKDKVEQDIKKCRIKADGFFAEWKGLRPKAEGKITAERAAGILEEIADWEDKYAALEKESIEVAANAKSFELPEPTFEVLEDIKEDIATYKSAWGLYSEYSTELGAMADEKWISFRGKLYTLDEFREQWTKRVKGRPMDAVTTAIRAELSRIKNLFPLLRRVTGEIFENEHWKILFAKLRFDGMTISKLTLRDFLDAGDRMAQLSRELAALAARAQGEVQIREGVQELRVFAEETDFDLLETQSGDRTVYLIREWKDLFTKLGDKRSLLQSLKESPHFPPFKDQVASIETRLALLDNVLRDLNSVQRKWVYLAPIFSRGALPQEQARFDRIDSTFLDLLAEIKENTNVMSLASIPGVQDTVGMLTSQLEQCSKALNNYLEQKRSKFPRFYFIGDDDLLEILGQAKNPTVILTHLRKLFAGIHGVDFTPDKKRIVAMRSSKGEVVPLAEPVLITDEVESWLQDLSDAMKATLRQMLAECVRDKEPDYDKYPAQILCVAEMVIFTSNCERAIAKRGLEQYHAVLRGKLAELTGIDSTNDKLLRAKVKVMVLDLIHNIDVVEQLQRARVTAVTDWQWQKQLRYYLGRPDAACTVRMCDAKFSYSYEYQGNANKLVHTPLTDKCYLVLTQGMHLGYGGNPYGPAGTGKTESVKALAQCLGRQTLVFNCDEAFDFRSMARIFKGLVKSGAWGCFDEFNRLKEDQLSAVSQQIQVIQAALKGGDATADILGHVVDVNPNAAIFVTMNPASKEYRGRSKLPHNLKQLFRAVAMSKPDTRLIAEVYLYAEGFQNAKDLGHKLVEIYNLSKQLLSSQKHYDWGLRSMNTVLQFGGTLIQRERKKGTTIDWNTEARLLVGALCINTLSKLSHADSVRFSQLVQDVFNGLKVEDVVNEQLRKVIVETLAALKYEFNESLVKKMLQLYTSLNQRVGCVIVGPSGCGKTVLWRVLKAALAKMGQRVVTHVMNPKAMDRTKLLGEMDPDTREWQDGVLTASARQVMKEPQEVQSWIICDGDIDPEWVESLNSVLDDNRLLTMPNGERIQFGTNVNFIFESHDLQFASPATISRMGMVLLSEEDVDAKALVNSWISQQPKDMRAKLASWIDATFYSALEWVLKTDCQVVRSSKIGAVQGALSQIRGVQTNEEYVLGVVRGLGSNMDLKARGEFATHICGVAGVQLPNPREPLNCYFDRKRRSLSAFTLNERSVRFEELSTERPPVIQTVQVQQNLAVVRPWLRQMRPFIVVGPEGSGKTLLLDYAFAEMKNTTVAVVNCSSQTSTKSVLNKLLERCNMSTTSSGRVLRPKEGERLILYFRNLNLPRPDKYNTCQLVSFLQQLITYGGFYDDSLDWIGVEKVQVVGAMNPGSTVGRHELSTRFSSIVSVLYLDYPDRDQLRSIYGSYLTAVTQYNRAGPRNMLQGESWSQQGAVARLATATVDIYQKLRQRFTVSEHRHYLFCPRDLTRWLFNLLRYDLASVSLLDAWAHEAHRIFADRLVEASNRRKFKELVRKTLLKDFKHEVKFDGACFTSLLGGDASAGAAGGDDSKSGGDAKSGGSRGIPKELGGELSRVGCDDFEALVRDAIRTYERDFKMLNLMLLPETLKTLAQLDRVLSKPGASLLLVGRAGVGRRSCVSIVAHMLNIEVVSPKLGRGYGMKKFKADLQSLAKRAGIDNERVLLYVEDYQVTSPDTLEAINSMLASGEVPGLFSSAELDPLLAPLKDEFERDGAHRTLYQFFRARVQRNVRIVLSFNPDHPRFAIRCESNPAIFTQCTVVWLGQWTDDTMARVPFLRLGSVVDEKDHENVVKLAQSVHASCKGGTPLQYVEFLNTYDTLFNAKRSKKEEETKRLQAGLSKLVTASETVDKLGREATVKRSKLTKKNAEADAQLKTISERMALSATRKQEADVLEKNLNVEQEKLHEKRIKIESELKDIQPLIDEAKKAVNGIRRDSLNEIRALRIPPPDIQNVLRAVLNMLGERDLTWNNIKRFLGSPSVKNTIMDFDARKITPEIRAKVIDAVRKNRSSFEQERIMHVNKSCAPLASWVKANIKYSVVLDNVKPLEMEKARATQQLKAAETRLARCKQEKIDLEEEVKQLNQTFRKTTEEAQVLKIELKKTEGVLNAARNLVEKLSGERDRWQVQVGDLNKEMAAIPYNALLAAGFVTYLGGLPEDERSSLLQRWKELAGVDDFDFRGFMSTESEMLQYKADGLPGDLLSMQNALVIHNAAQTPFILDPNASATRWLRVDLKKHRSVEVVMQQAPRFVNALELAVRFGKTLVVLEVDHIEPILVPVLRRDLVRQGPRWVVHVGDKLLDYNENFRLFLVTRNAESQLTADMSALVTEVNFTITRSGLEGQLLGITLSKEMPELEMRKSKLLKEEEEMKIQIAKLEQSLLHELATSEGDILQNKALIESLNQTKKQALVINEALQKSKQVGLDLDRQRNVYRPIARTGSKLFFSLAQLRAVNHMYQYSLTAFVDIFEQTLEIKGGGAQGRSPTAKDGNRVTGRIRLLCSQLIKRVYDYVVLSLFKADRLMFGLHMAHCMFGDEFQPDEWETMTGEAVLPESKDAAPVAKWAASLPADARSRLQTLATVFPSLARRLNLDDAGWPAFCRDPQPETKELPNSRGNVSEFQKLLVVSAIRRDRIISAMGNFVCKMIDKESLAPPPADMAALNAMSSRGMPILFMTSAGADPSRDIEEFAVKTIGKEKFHQLAMGSGQGDAALGLVRQAAATGGMVLLKNLHLVTSWLGELEKTIKSVSATANPAFRVWMTTEMHDNFSPILLQQSLKMSYEAPPGIKENLLRTYGQWTPRFVGSGGTLRARLLFALAWFHAIVQERRSYVPQGWTKFYEFSNADLRSGADVIDATAKQVRSSDDIPWLTLLGLFKDAIYGGRIDSEHDIKVLEVYLRRFFSANIGAGRGRLSRTAKLPDSNQHRDYVAMIKNMPSVDAPDLFGLPANIGKLVVDKRRREVVAQLRKLAVSSSLSNKFNKLLWRTQLKGMFKSWYKASSNPLVLQQPPERPGGVTSADLKPVESFVEQEMDRVWGMVVGLKESLGNLDNLLYKTGLLTPQIQMDGKALLRGDVPDSWRKLWWGPDDPKLWIQQVVARKVALHQWLEHARAGTLLNQPLCFGDLFNAKVLLNSLRQQTAREAKRPIGELKLVCRLGEAKMPASATITVRVTGLFLQGSSIKDSKLSQITSANIKSLSILPDLKLGWVPETEAAVDVVQVPLYFSTAREEFICNLGLPCVPNTRQGRILAGTALFASDV